MIKNYAQGECAHYFIQRVEPQVLSEAETSGKKKKD
jgi:hypothetical protein